jgi:aarF domain-containing kinase
MLKNRLKPPPEEIYSLHRKLSGSYLTCIRLKAKVDCQEIWKQIQFKVMAHAPPQSKAEQRVEMEAGA